MTSSGAPSCPLVDPESWILPPAGPETQQTPTGDGSAPTHRQRIDPPAPPHAPPRL